MKAKRSAGSLQHTDGLRGVRCSKDALVIQSPLFGADTGTIPPLWPRQIIDAHVVTSFLTIVIYVFV